MTRKCERVAIIALAQEDIFSYQPDGLFHCPTWGCTAVFSYSKERGLQLVEGVKRCDEVNAEIATLGRILDERNPFKIKPEDKLAFVFRLRTLSNEASDESFYKD